MTLSRHLVYLDAQGVTPLMLRIPVDGALPSVVWPLAADDTHESVIETHSIADTVSVNETVATVTAELRNDLIRPAEYSKSAEQVLPDTTVQAAQVESPVVSFNFAIATAGTLVLIDEIQPKSNRRQQQQLLSNIAQALSITNLAATKSSLQFVDLNWPLKDHPALDHSDKGAFSFIQTWAESLTTRQHARFVVLFGETAKHWFSPALDALHLASVVVPSSNEMFEHSEKKAECWRLIRAYQALVSAAPATSTSHFE